MKKIIGVDLDGTLLNNDSHASQKNLEAISSLYEKGVITCIVTGRTYYEIPQELRECEAINYFIYSDGAGIYSKKDKVNIFLDTISRNDTAELLKFLQKYDTYIEIYSNGEPVNEAGRLQDDILRHYGIGEIFIKEMHRSRKTMVKLEEYAESDECKTELFDVFYHSQKERAECFEKLPQLFPHIEFTSSMPTNIEIMKKGVAKGNSFKFLCKTLEIEPENTFAIGDSKNDISLFNVVKMRFAPKNACDEIKQLADKVICSNEENVMVYLNEKLF